ncbi:MAG: hypothetical protein VX417_04685, partial [SAR324 cluster bacterium]|nr:hypothetical protein [SAR324 cluster bacterium]
VLSNIEELAGMGWIGRNGKRSDREAMKQRLKKGIPFSSRAASPRARATGKGREVPYSQELG